LSARKPLTPAEKQRRYRRRQREGVQVVQVDVDDALIIELIEAGLLAEAESEDAEKVARALRASARRL
jgi:hypothetical protein